MWRDDSYRNDPQQTAGFDFSIMGISTGSGNPYKSIRGALPAAISGVQCAGRIVFQPPAGDLIPPREPDAGEVLGVPKEPFYRP